MNADIQTLWNIVTGATPHNGFEERLQQIGVRHPKKLPVMLAGHSQGAKAASEVAPLLKDNLGVILSHDVASKAEIKGLLAWEKPKLFITGCGENDTSSANIRISTPFSAFQNSAEDAYFFLDKSEHPQPFKIPASRDVSRLFAECVLFPDATAKGGAPQTSRRAVLPPVAPEATAASEPWPPYASPLH